MSNGAPHERTDGEDTDTTTEYEFDPAVESATEAVVSAVAEAAGVDPTELPPIYGAVNPDALDTLLARDADVNTLYLSFSYAGYDVFIWNGTVTVERTRE